MAILNEKRSRILSLDGGGVRGFLSLLILREIVDNIEKSVGTIDVRQYEYFDLIGGTSTEGLIAIILGNFGDGISTILTPLKVLRPWMRMSLITLTLSEEVFKADQVLAGYVPMGDHRCHFDYNNVESDPNLYALGRGRRA